MLTINNTYKIPTCWQEVRWQDYEKLSDGVLAFLESLNIPESIFLENSDLVQTALSFFSDEIPAWDCKIINAYELQFDTYIDLILCTSAIDFLASYDLRGQNYSEADYEQKKQEVSKEFVVQRIAIVQKLREQINSIEKEISEHYQKYKIPETHAQKVAGVFEFSQRWGYYAIIDALSGGDFLKKQEVLKRKMIDIVVELKYLNEKFYYQWKLQKELENEFDRKTKKRI